MFDISPKVALYGPTRKADTAPANIATVRICGEIPITCGFKPSVISASDTAGCSPKKAKANGMKGSNIKKISTPAKLINLFTQSSSHTFVWETLMVEIKKPVDKKIKN